MKFDFIVIGSGPGGYKAALTAAHLGARVAIIEKGEPGGTCLNEGCIPSVMLVRLARLIEDASLFSGLGLEGSLRGDFHAAMEHKDTVVSSIRKNFGVWLQRLGVVQIMGQARFLCQDTLVVQDSSGRIQHYQAEKIIVACGAKPKPHPTCPTDGTIILNSSDFMRSLRVQPDSVLCVGGGAVNVELGYVLRQFGVSVTMIERGGRLIPQAPERASVALERKLRRMGVRIRKNTQVEECSRTQQGVQVRFNDGEVETYSKLLVAIGRIPNTAELDLEKAGIQVDADGFVRVSEYLETSAPGIYAIGDATSGPMTASAALHGAKVAASNALRGNHQVVDYLHVPLVIHSALEVAAVGLTEAQAESEGLHPEVARANFGGSGKANAYHATEGFVEAVHDEESGRILGGCVVGLEAGEQIQLLTAASQMDLGLGFFHAMSYSHPSWCEEMETAASPFALALPWMGKSMIHGSQVDLQMKRTGE